MAAHSLDYTSTSNCKTIGQFAIENQHFQGQFSITSAFSIENSKQSWHIDCNSYNAAGIVWISVCMFVNRMLSSVIWPNRSSLRFAIPTAADCNRRPASTTSHRFSITILSFFKSNSSFSTLGIVVLQHRTSHLLPLSFKCRFKSLQKLRQRLRSGHRVVNPERAPQHSHLKVQRQPGQIGGALQGRVMRSSERPRRVISCASFVLASTLQVFTDTDEVLASTQ